MISRRSLQDVCSDGFHDKLSGATGKGHGCKLPRAFYNLLPCCSLACAIRNVLKFPSTGLRLDTPLLEFLTGVNGDTAEVHRVRVLVVEQQGAADRGSSWVSLDHACIFLNGGRFLLDALAVPASVTVCGLGGNMFIRVAIFDGCFSSCQLLFDTR